MVHGNTNESGAVSKVNIGKNRNKYMVHGWLYQRFLFYSIMIKERLKM